MEYIMGTSIVDGIRVGHTEYEISALKKFLGKYKPDTFIELGVHEGGLSWLLLPSHLSKYYIGIEINCSIVVPRVKLLYASIENARLICDDCFSEKLRDMIFVTNKIISPSEKFILYCDGGNKAKELLHFADTIAVGNIIMCHDYWDGKEKIIDVPSPHAEVTPEDIKFLEKNFIRIDDILLQGTRIVAFLRIK